MTKIWTASNGALVRRIATPPAGFIVGTTKPTAANTGPAAGGYNPSLNVINGDVTMTTGQVIENTTINGYVNMASGSILRGCIVQGRNAGVYPQRGSMVGVSSSFAIPPLLEFCKIRPYAPIHPSMNNFVTSGPWKMTRCDVSGGVDFIKASGTQTAGDVYGNYFHGYSFRNDDGDQPNPPVGISHNDIVQFNNGIVGFNFRGNTVEMYYDPALSVGAPSSNESTGWGGGITVSGTTRTQGLFINKNWFSGGAAGVFQANLYPSAQGSVSMGEVSENRVALDQYSFGANSRYQIRYATAYASLIRETTNYFDASLPGVTAAGVPDGKLFVLGTTSTSGIRRP